jgi:phosphoglycolate phosphatase-like HAD superfamily hydrolase
LNNSVAERLLLFDIDGTLINTAGAGVHALRNVLRDQFGISHDLEGIEIAGRTDAGIVHQILRQQKIEPNESNTTRFLNHYVESLKDELPKRKGRVLPGVRELLERLQAKPGIVLALLTGNVKRGAKLKLEHYDLWHFFEFGAFSDDHHDRNRLGMFALERAQEKVGREVRAADVDVIGDTPHDIACGKAIGARTIAVATGNYSAEQLVLHKPDWIFENLADVDSILRDLDW